jgi:hypothetical protein
VQKITDVDRIFRYSPSGRTLPRSRGTLMIDRGVVKLHRSESLGTSVNHKDGRLPNVYEGVGVRKVAYTAGTYAHL